MSSPRFGLGPVFAYEWLRISRRWQLYALRSFFVGLLLLGLMFTWGAWGDRPDGMQTEELARLGQTIYSTIVTIELTLILLAAPAATAGAVCVDKARGSLLQVMATDLSDSEIVLGKLAAALTPVVGLVFCTLPVLMLSSLLGGIDPILLMGSFLTTLSTAVLVCTLAFTLSVWGKKAHEVLGATYMILLAWLALLPFVVSMLMLMAGLGPVGFSWFGRLIQATNPYAQLYPSYNGSMDDHLFGVLVYSGGCLSLSAAMIGLCIATIRRVTVRQRSEGGEGRTRRRTWRMPSILPTPSLDANPVLWREWTRNRPSRWGRFVSACYLGFALFLTGVAVLEFLRSGALGDPSPILAVVYIVGVGLLLMSVRSSTSLSEERIRGSLDLLTSTPLTTTEILAGKWWGTFRMVVPMISLPGLIATLVCGELGWWTGLPLYLGLLLAYAGVTTSLGLAIAVWVPQQGRAVGLCVGLYVAACVGWPLLTLLMMLTGGPHSEPAIFFLFGSPIAGTGLGLISLAEHRSGGDFQGALVPTSMIVWTFALGAATLVLFQLACESFDAQLGRKTDWGNMTGGAWGNLKALIPRFGGQPLGKPKPATTEVE